MSQISEADCLMLQAKVAYACANDERMCRLVGRLGLAIGSEAADELLVRLVALMTTIVVDQIPRQSDIQPRGILG